MYREEFAKSVEVYRKRRRRFENRWIAIFCLVASVFIALLAHFENTDTFPGWDFYLGVSSSLLAAILLFPVFTGWWDRRERRSREFSCSDCGESWDDKALSRILATGICRHCGCSVVWDGEDDTLETQGEERIAVDEFRSRLETYRKKARRLYCIYIALFLMGSVLGGRLAGLLKNIDILNGPNAPGWAWFVFSASAVISILILAAVSLYCLRWRRRVLDALGLRCAICGDAFTGETELLDDSVSSAVLEIGNCPSCGIGVLHVERGLD
jgi:hypothetical protein